MKYLKLIAAVLISISAKATTYVVSNVPGFPAQFTSLQAAIDDVTVLPGSILLVQGSGTDYGAIELTKRLTIMGPGYFLNQNPETQAAQGTAKLLSIDCKAGSNGSIIQGIEITSSIACSSDNFPTAWSPGAANIGQCCVNVEGVGITFISVNFQPSANWVHLKNSNGTSFSKCYGDGVYCSNGVSNLNIDNCIFDFGAYLKNASVRNTVFDLGFNGNDAHAFIDCDVKNSILYPCSYYTNINSTITNSLVIGCDNGLGLSGNITGVDANAIFVGYPTQGSYSNDGKFKLKNGSPAIGGGENGIDIGPFGGSSPYKLSGMSFHPNIWFVNMPTIGTANGGLQVQVKVNAND